VARQFRPREDVEQSSTGLVDAGTENVLGDEYLRRDGCDERQHDWQSGQASDDQPDSLLVVLAGVHRDGPKGECMRRGHGDHEQPVWK
jgi:hypothetical protein